MNDTIERAWDMMASISTCMLVSQGLEGLRSRPLSAIVRREQKRVHFISVADSLQIAEISANSDVMMNFANGSSQFLAAKATATTSHDRALIRELWNPGAQSFWPEGPEAANVAVITCLPRQAEYWDGPSGIIAAAKIAFALATSSKPDLGDNKVVKLRG